MVENASQQVTMASIVLAGATGDLGGRVAKALVAQGASVRALLRAGTPADKLAAVAALGAEPLPVDFADAAALQRACRGAACVVSVVNGLDDVILGLQVRLLEAAVAAGVRRFIPSDFALDFTKTEPGRNRNLDLRRAFKKRIDHAPIRATSILNGGFMDLLEGQAPLILHRWRRVLHWGSADQKYDFTTKDDVAAYTASAALAEDTPRILRIAGDQVSPRDLARIMTDLSGRRYRLLRAGGTGQLGLFIRLAQAFDRDPQAVFPPWQGMQYLRDMAEGKGALAPLDNDRFGVRHWTSARELLARR
jgi:uncharacterized protein YbjT (DUF2867 family)